jgi:nucleolar MIF4G domain-containing protein 1
LKELLTQVFLSTQLSTPLANESVPPTRRNESAVREVFVKATRVEALAMGLAYFIGETFRSEQDTEMAQLIKWAVGIARGTLQVDVQI